MEFDESQHSLYAALSVLPSRHRGRAALDCVLRSTECTWDIEYFAQIAVTNSFPMPTSEICRPSIWDRRARNDCRAVRHGTQIIPLNTLCYVIILTISCTVHRTKSSRALIASFSESFARPGSGSITMVGKITLRLCPTQLRLFLHTCHYYSIMSRLHA